MRIVIVSAEMRTVSVLAALALVAAAPGCGGAESDGGFDVVAGFYPLAFAAERVAVDGVSVTNLTPPGAEPHDVELSPSDVARLQRADLVLYLGDGFQPALEEAARDGSAQTVDLLDGLDVPLRGDPHVWLDPVLFATVVGHVGELLGGSERAEKLAEELHRLDRDYRAGLADCERREIVTSHAAFAHLARRYDLRQVAIAGIEPEAEPSAGRLAELAEQIRRDRVRTVFFETLVSPRVAETLAREAGVPAAVLNPIEGLTEAEAERGEDYFSLMRRNLATLRKALGCR
jgi:zinc transport system substrate-binding protein